MHQMLRKTVVLNSTFQRGDVGESSLSVSKMKNTSEFEILFKSGRKTN